MSSAAPVADPAALFPGAPHPVEDPQGWAAYLEGLNAPVEGGPRRCAHLGQPNGKLVGCAGCPAPGGRPKTMLKVHACRVHTECVLGEPANGFHGCVGCGQFRRAGPPPPAPRRVHARDLAYYVCPVAGNGVWQRNVAHLLRNASLFNGKKVVTVATGGCTTDEGFRALDHPEEVRDALAELGDFELLTRPNDPGLREAAALGPMLERLESGQPGRTLFLAHAKGVTRPVNPGVTVHPWADVLYESLLDYWPAVERVLLEHPCAGTFKKVGEGFAGSASSWHYSGSFGWFRSADLFSRDWRHFDRAWWGIESYPGLHFLPEEAGCVFHEGFVPGLNLYSMDYLRGVVLPEWGRWKADNAKLRRVPA